MPATGDALNYYLAINGYIAVEVDADSSLTYMYYLYVNKFAHWYLMRQEKISDTQYECKFSKGVESSGTNWRSSSIWTARSTAAQYKFPDEMFKDL